MKVDMLSVIKGFEIESSEAGRPEIPEPWSCRVLDGQNGVLWRCSQRLATQQHRKVLWPVLATLPEAS
jgi:hypothetical protein